MTATEYLVGYARVSTTDQNPQLQLDALERAGCRRTVVDRASGAKTNRPQLDAALDYLRRGDTLCVWRLDRLGRSLPHLIQVATTLADRGIALRSMTEQIDTASAGGRLVFNIFGALAEFERALISERTLAGLEAARSRGRVGGRPSAMTPKKLAVGQRMMDAVEPDGRPIYVYNEIAAALKVSRSTVVRPLTCVSEPRAATGSDTHAVTRADETVRYYRRVARETGRPFDVTTPTITTLPAASAGDGTRGRQVEIAASDANGTRQIVLQVVQTRVGRGIVALSAVTSSRASFGDAQARTVHRLRSALGR